MTTDFVSWLIAEMNQRGWTNSELARRAGVVPSAISMLGSGQTNPGVSMCQGLAQAFKLPVEVVYRKAGLLPELQSPVTDEQLTTLYDYYKRLSQKAREDAVEYVVFKYKQEHDA